MDLAVLGIARSEAISEGHLQQSQFGLANIRPTGTRRGSSARSCRGRRLPAQGDRNCDGLTARGLLAHPGCL